VDCNKAQQLISLYLAGDIGREDLEALTGHMAACEKCRAAFNEAKRYEAALKGVFQETVSKARSPKSRVLRKIKEQGERKPRGKSLANWFVFIVLMAVLAFLLVIAYVSYERIRQDNHNKSMAARARLQLVMRALNTYRTDCGSYPPGPNSRMVKALRTSSKEPDKPYFAFRRDELVKGKFVDPWGSPYIYKSTGETALIYSAGPNRRDDDGVPDDIRP
jgi:type II secretory pathway pseudopilin PulG